MPMCSRAGTFFLKRVQIIRQEHRTVIHFQLSFAVRLEIAYLVGRKLVVATTYQLAAYFGCFTHFQFLGYGQRFHRERVSLPNVQTVITGGYKHEGGHDVALTIISKFSILFPDIALKLPN